MIELKNVSFRYGSKTESGGVSDINLTIRDGETVLLTGASGCGKTTVTRLINGLVPHFFAGELSGEVILNGTHHVESAELYETARLVGSVFQNPRSQFFNVDTDSEIAFGCENMGMAEEEIRRRMAHTVEEFGIEKLLHRSIFRLSGGEKQKIACASVRTLDPAIYVFDEPSSNLDIASIKDLSDIIQTIKKAGHTIVITEHRLAYLKGLADRVIYMKDGRMEREYTGAEFEALSNEELAELGLRSNVRFTAANQLAELNTPQFMLKKFRFAYQNGFEALHIDECHIPIQSVCAIIGQNGAGKTSLLRTVCGLEQHSRGTMKAGGKTIGKRKRKRACYLVMQDVNHQLYTESVLDEVLLSMKKPDRERAMEILTSLDLSALCDMHPMALSGGQKQRVAIASAIAADRDIIVFDEPTSGLDLAHMKEIAENIKQLQKAGKTILIVTHDPELIAACCDFYVFMEAGKVLWADRMTEETAARLNEFFSI